MTYYCATYRKTYQCACVNRVGNMWTSIYAFVRLPVSCGMIRLNHTKVVELFANWGEKNRTILWDSLANNTLLSGQLLYVLIGCIVTISRSLIPFQSQLFHFVYFLLIGFTFCIHKWNLLYYYNKRYFIKVIKKEW